VCLPFYISNIETMYIPNVPKIAEPQSEELANALAENARLKKELELARIRDENRKMQEEINRINNPYQLWPYAPVDINKPQVIYCTLEA